MSFVVVHCSIEAATEASRVGTLHMDRKWPLKSCLSSGVPLGLPSHTTLGWCSLSVHPAEGDLDPGQGVELTHRDEVQHWDLNGSESLEDGKEGWWITEAGREVYGVYTP